MFNSDFWKQNNSIIAEGFSPEGLAILDKYADEFTCGQLIYERFSPKEQHGCATGGNAHVIASLLAGAENSANSVAEECDDFKRQLQRGKTQSQYIEQWARAVGCWNDNVDESLERLFGEQIAEGGEAHVYDYGSSLIKSIGLDYFVEPILALDRITLHNTLFPETRMVVKGFGSDSSHEFRIVVEQHFIKGNKITDSEIRQFLTHIGFTLINPRNWTYATPDIYLSNVHDENVLRLESGSVAVVDCDIRINTPELRCGGVRSLTTEVSRRKIVKCEK